MTAPRGADPTGREAIEPAQPRGTESLADLVQQGIEALGRAPAPAAPSAESLLFLGSWSDALPRLLIEDPVLFPIDKIVWQVVKLHAAPQSATAFPSYRTIGRLANVASDASIARALTILRCARWLTLCARVRDPQGRFRGNVYALHEAPLPLPDTLGLDPDYLRFLKAGCAHRHGRVRRIAAAAYGTIEDAVLAGGDVLEMVTELERRAEAAATVHDRRQGAFFSFNDRQLLALRSPPSSNSEDGGETGGWDKNFEDGGARSSSKREIWKKEETEERTTTTAEKGEADAAPGGDPELIFPEALTDNHRALAALYLGTLAGEQRQRVLDELAGRLRAVARGAPPLYDPVRFLKKLCDAARGGTFVLNHGAAVRAARARRQAVDDRALRADRTDTTTSPPDLSSRAVRIALRIADRARQKNRTDENR